MSYCKLIVVGNLTRDPELRYTPKGTAVAQGGVAVNRKWKTESGDEKEEVTFIDWSAWGRMGEVIAQYHKKGSMVMFDGRLKTESWDDKQTGQKRQKLVMVVEAFSFMNQRDGDGVGNRDSNTTGRPTPANPRSSPRPSEPVAGDEPRDEDQDVPF